MNKQQTYRLIAAYLMVALIVQVVFLQGLHHMFGHDHGEACDVEGTHFHSEEHAHFSCDICLFQFTPSELGNEELNIPGPSSFQQEIQEEYQRNHCSLRYLLAYLRGPPQYLV